MDATTQRICVWSGAGLMFLFGLGFMVIAGFVPPPPPTNTAEQVKLFYVENQTRIQIGLIVTTFGAVLAFPWTAVISVQIKRMEGRWTPLGYTQLASGLCLALVFLFPVMVWAVAAYRPQERSAELTQAINDLAWIPFIGIGTPAVIQSLAIGLAILRDRRPVPVMPRWVGYFNIWCALTFLPTPFDIAFKTGPFAWNGIFTFWIPLTFVGAWFVVMTVYLLKAITQQARKSTSPIGEAEPQLA